MSVDLAELNAMASTQFGAMKITTPVADFRAQVTHARVGDIDLFDMTTPPHKVDRGPSYIHKSDPPTYKLSLQLEGHSTIHQYGREARLEPGMLAIYNSHVPYILDYPDHSRTLIMQFPADFITVMPSVIKSITALPITKNDRLGKVAIPLFEQLAMNFDVLEGPHATALLQSAIDMLVAVLSQELSAAGFRSSDVVEQALAYIDANLADPDLGPHDIATELFISTRHLHAQFANADHSVSAYIKHARLERIRKDLANPNYAHLSISHIGERYGITSPAHLSRIFKVEYGQTPREYRKRILGA